jgi:hypothetical protein
VGPLLRNGLRALVGVQDIVSSVGSIAFVKKLYSALAVGLSLDEAVTWARLHLLLESPDPEDRGRAGLTHHNSEAGLYGKFRIPNKLKLLPYSLATFR